MPNIPVWINLTIWRKKANHRKIVCNVKTSLNNTLSKGPTVYHRNYIQYSVISLMRKNMKRNVCVCIYIYIYTTYVCITELFHCIAEINIVNKFKIYALFGVKYHSKTEKAMAPHSSTLAWKIPWTEEPYRLQSMGSLGVGHNWATSLSLFTLMHWRRKWQPTPVFLPGESQGRGSLVGCRLWGRTESDTTEVT